MGCQGSEGRAVTHFGSRRAKMQAQGFRPPGKMTADPCPPSETQGSPLNTEQSGIAQQRVVCGTRDRPCCSSKDCLLKHQGPEFPPVAPAPVCPPVLSGARSPVPHHHTCPFPPPGFWLFLPPKFSFPLSSVGTLPLLQGPAQIPLCPRTFWDSSSLGRCHRRREKA